MPKLTAIEGGRDSNSRSSEHIEIHDQMDEPEFGAPPNLIVGAITALLGCGAGVVSLLIFFFLWEPHSYISPRWMLFVLLGGIVGYFLRIERRIIKEFYRANITDADRFL